MRLHSSLTATLVSLLTWSTSPAVRGEEHEPRAVTSSAPLPPNPARDKAGAALAQLQQWVRERGGQLSAEIRDLRSGNVVLASGGELPLNPASTMKLITAAAALDVLGPDYRFETGLYGTLRDGRISRLVLRGHGDPSLSEADLWRLANSLANQGVQRIDELWVDQSAFDSQFVPPAFAQQPNEWASFRAPVSAIALERNALTVNVLPQAESQPARVWVEPSNAADVEGSVLTSKAGDRERVQLSVVEREGRVVTILGGSLPQGLPRQRYSRRLEDPRLVPGWTLQKLLERQGIVVGKVALGGSDEKTRLAYVTSAPLSVLLHELGKNSDNFYAEMLFKALSRARDTAAASSDASARLVTEWLERDAPLPAGSRIENGSGLFDANRVAASTLNRVLLRFYQDSKHHAEFLAQLASGGRDGTLRSRFRAAGPGTVRAKTGTLERVVALSGYAFGAGPDDAFAFSVIVNGVPAAHAALRPRIDAIVSPFTEGH